MFSFAEGNEHGRKVNCLRPGGGGDGILSMPGISNGDVIEKANQMDAVLITADKDFGEMVFQQRLVNKGVMFIRLAS